MTGTWLQPGRGAHRRGLRGFAVALCLAPMLCVADSMHGASSATSQLRITVIVPPVFRVLQVTPTSEGYDYRVWTNMRSVVFGGREYRFDRIGETTLRLRTSPDQVWMVHGL